MNFDGGCINHGQPSVALAVEQAAALQREKRTRKASPRWTAEHWEYAESLSETMSGSEIAKALTARFGIKRSWKSVKHQFERRRVSKPEVRSATRTVTRKAVVAMGPRKHWTVPEVAALDDGEVTLLYRVRTKNAVKAKARRIGTTVRSGDGMMSLRQVAQRWRVHPNVVLQWVNRGLLPAERNGDLWRIDPATADAIVPVLAKVSRRMCGRPGWWNDPELRAFIDRKQRQVRRLERNVDDLLRPGLVRSEE